jgi:SAM-dependent methyltransferase
VPALVRLFSLVNRLPAARRRLWREWYRYLSRRFPDDDWSFMNYGLVTAAPLALRPPDEGDRLWIQLYQHVAGAVDLTGRQVLEVGSGRGGGASFVARYHAPAALVGLDISDSAVALCRQRHRAPNLSFQQGDAEALPFPAGTFDAVINVESSHCYGALPRFLAEVRRVLRPGGHFLYADFRARQDVPTWTAQIAAAGFVERRRQDITADVARSMTDDGERRRRVVERTVPGYLLSAFCQFAGLPGSVIHEELRTGGLTYLSFVLAPTG